MFALRQFLAALLAVSLVAYGAAAQGSAHAHGVADFEAVHLIAIDAHHDHDNAAHGSAPHDGGIGGEPGGAEHHETGLHSHSTSQFSEAEQPSYLIAVTLAGQPAALDPRSPAALRREKPPFKPPRSVL